MEFSSINLKRWFLLIFVLALIGLNATIFVFYTRNEDLARSHQWVSHTYQVLDLTYGMFIDVADAETAQRGYLLAGDKIFLQASQASSAKADDTIKTLQRMTADNFGRQTDLGEFRKQFDDHRQMLDRLSTARDAGHMPTQTDLLATRQSLEMLRGLYRHMVADETGLLTVRLNAERAKQTSYVHSVFLASAVSILGLLLANGVIVFLSLRRQAAEANLIRINKEMEGFTYIASHDLRSPLVNLKGFASEMRYGIDELQPIVDRAMENAPESDRKKVIEVLHQDIPEALGYIHASVEKMDKLTNAILELSRIGRRGLKYEAVDTNKVVRHVLDTLHHQIDTLKIQVKVHPLPEVFADQLSIEQVFGNVIDNAIKYLDPKRTGALEIGAYRNFRETVFWVKDNGRGISDYDQQKIFEIYRRGGGVQDVSGEGMGMAYVRATLRRLDGAIWFDSKQGVGTTFSFSISNTLTKKEA